MSCPLIPRLTGMRSPRLWWVAASSGLSGLKPPLALALDPRSARFRAATVRVPTVPLGVSREARWKRLTARNVPVPNRPSSLTLKPACPSACCSSRTSAPEAPARSVRSPRCDAFASARLARQHGTSDGEHEKNEK